MKISERQFPVMIRSEAELGTFHKIVIAAREVEASLEAFETMVEPGMLDATKERFHPILHECADRFYQQVSYLSAHIDEYRPPDPEETPNDAEDMFPSPN